MKCPNCKIEMQEIKSKSHYDAPVILDQCPQCGGLWFDAFEVFTIKHGEASNIESEINTEMINSEKLREYKVFESEELLCPRDGAKLELFRDLNFPKEIQVESCHQCGGFWLNRGEFGQYQDYLKVKKEKNDNKKLDENFENQIDALFRLHGKNNSLDNLAKFLSQPVESSYYGSTRHLGIGGIAFGVARALLRLFLGI